MSGGYFGYSQYRINDIVTEIEQAIYDNDSQELNEWGDKKGKGYPIEIIEHFRDAVACLKRAEIYAQRIDWLLSGDDGEESFIERLREELEEVN